LNRIDEEVIVCIKSINRIQLQEYVETLKQEMCNDQRGQRQQGATDEEAQQHNSQATINQVTLPTEAETISAMSEKLDLVISEQQSNHQTIDLLRSEVDVVKATNVQLQENHTQSLLNMEATMQRTKEEIKKEIEEEMKQEAKEEIMEEGKKVVKEEMRVEFEAALEAKATEIRKELRIECKEAIGRLINELGKKVLLLDSDTAKCIMKVADKVKEVRFFANGLEKKINKLESIQRVRENEEVYEIV